MGADYRKAPKQVIGAQSGNTLIPNVTRYANPGGSVFHAAEGDARMRIPFDCVIRLLYCRSEFPPGAGDTYTYTIMVNGIASILTAQIAGAAAVEGNDLVNAVAVAAGDELTIRVVTSVGAAQGYHLWSWEILT